MSAFFVALRMILPEGAVLPILAYALLQSFSLQFLRETRRWFAAPFFVAACLMLTTGAWIVKSPAVSKDPLLREWMSFMSAGIALLLALVVFFFPWDVHRVKPEGLATGSAADGARPDTRGRMIAPLGVLGGMLGIVAACVTLGTHGLALGLPAFVLAVIGIMGAVLADGSEATGYVLLLAAGVLGFFFAWFAWFFWIPAGVILVIAGLLEARLVRAHRARPRETGGI